MGFGSKKEETVKTPIYSDYSDLQNLYTGLNPLYSSFLNQATANQQTLADMTTGNTLENALKKSLAQYEQSQINQQKNLLSQMLEPLYQQAKATAYSQAGGLNNSVANALFEGINKQKVTQSANLVDALLANRLNNQEALRSSMLLPYSNQLETALNFINNYSSLANALTNAKKPVEWNTTTTGGGSNLAGDLLGTAANIGLSFVPYLVGNKTGGNIVSGLNSNSQAFSYPTPSYLQSGVSLQDAFSQMATPSTTKNNQFQTMRLRTL